MGEQPQSILVVDDDDDITKFIEMNLVIEGFSVRSAHNGGQALEMIGEERPDLVILDLMMPVLDGIEVTQRLRASSLTTALPIILLTAKGQTTDKVLGLTAGADDYLVKPFAPLELVARVHSLLRRNQEFREVSPLTGLPGNTRILCEITDRLSSSEDFAVCHFDIDGFKAVNDVYGLARGDEFIITMARKLTRAVLDGGLPPAFLGHVGGDDFVVICTPEQIRPLTERAVADFERAADELYDPEDRERRYISVKKYKNRDDRTDVGLVTVSIGVALSSSRNYTDPRELMEVASEMKTVAKNQPGSYVAMDRRRYPRRSL